MSIRSTVRRLVENDLSSLSREELLDRAWVPLKGGGVGVSAEVAKEMGRRAIIWLRDQQQVKDSCHNV